MVRKRGPVSRLPGMSLGEPVRVDMTLELASVGDPPSGRILVAGASHPFEGWLGLGLALQMAIDECGVTPGRTEE